jgi:uncharacterized membrane protein
MSIDTPPLATPVAAPAGEDRTVAILTYITIIGFIIAIVMHSSKKSALGAFHLRQGLGLFLTAVVGWIPCAILAVIPVVGLLMIVVWPALCIGLFVLWLLGLIAAVNGQQKPMPVLGEHYQKWFAGAFV